MPVFAKPCHTKIKNIAVKLILSETNDSKMNYQETNNSNSDSDDASKTSESNDWAAEAADKIVASADTLKAKLIAPFKPLAKFIAYLPLIILAITGLVVLVVIGVFRLVDVYLPQATWLAHLIVGSVFSLTGFIIWVKRPRFPN